MSKVPVLKPRELLRALERAGFHAERQKGSHLQLKKGNLLVTLPLHPRDINPATLHSILRQARLTPEELRALL